MYNITVERNGNIYNYKCEDCGWKDSMTLNMIISKKEDHTMRLSLYRNDTIEIKELDEQSKGG
jgi:hypothetical protein